MSQRQTSQVFETFPHYLSNTQNRYQRQSQYQQRMLQTNALGFNNGYCQAYYGGLLNLSGKAYMNFEILYCSCKDKIEFPFDIDNYLVMYQHSLRSYIVEMLSLIFESKDRNHVNYIDLYASPFSFSLPFLFLFLFLFYLFDLLILGLKMFLSELLYYGLRFFYLLFQTFIQGLFVCFVLSLLTFFVTRFTSMGP